MYMHAETCAKKQGRPRQPSDHLHSVFYVSLIQPLFGSDGRKRRFASILLSTAQFCSAQQLEGRDNTQEALQNELVRDIKLPGTR